MTARERGWMLVALFTLAFLLFVWNSAKGGSAEAQIHTDRCAEYVEVGDVWRESAERPRQFVESMAARAEIAQMYYLRALACLRGMNP